MILLDTNVLLDAFEPDSPYFDCYQKRRKSQSDSPGPSTPLPDFFIGAQATVMGWELATADRRRFRTYFPSVHLKTP